MNHNCLRRQLSLLKPANEYFYAEQCLCAGTMFMNAGFSRHWKRVLSFNIPNKLIHKNDKILKRILGNYERSLLLPTAVLDEEALRDNTKEFNEKYGLKIQSRQGSLTLLENAWKITKQAVGK